jgi:hypothetical protein
MEPMEDSPAETSFGGGKTHSLMAVYHLAKGARPANLTDFVDPAILPERCQVADTLDPENGLVTNGIRSYTRRRCLPRRGVTAVTRPVVGTAMPTWRGR